MRVFDGADLCVAKVFGALLGFYLLVIVASAAYAGYFNLTDKTVQLTSLQNITSDNREFVYGIATVWDTQYYLFNQETPDGGHKLLKIPSHATTIYNDMDGQHGILSFPRPNEYIVHVPQRSILQNQ